MKKLFYLLCAAAVLGLYACDGKDDSIIYSVDDPYPEGDYSADVGIPSDMVAAFPDAIFRTYVLQNFDTDGNGIISNEEALAIREIRFNQYSTSHERIQSLKGIQYFINLVVLLCDYNALTELDISQNTILTVLSCDYNQLTVLDISRNTALMYLSCSGNYLTNLDVTKNIALTVLHCSDNQLAALDISQNTALTQLECTDNQLTSLDVSKNTALTELGCSSNQLTTLDVSQNSALEWLWCSSNRLTSLDVSQNIALIRLDCFSNQLSELDLSKTNLVNSSYNKDRLNSYPLRCAPMPTLKTLYLKKGWSIKWITEDWNRSSDYIPDETEIVFVD